MAKHDYDLIILGGGSAGIVSGVMAGGLGLRVLLLEKGKMGGECLNTGCSPSKALIHAARVAQTIRTASEVGFAPLSVTREDAAGVLRHVRETINTVREADATEQLLRDQNVEIRQGDAHFVDPHTLHVDGQMVTADSFILATGSRPADLDVPGLTDAGFLTNQTVFDLDEIPESLLVVGGGSIGVEMAQAFQRLGSRVALAEMGDRLLPHDDAELTAMLAGYLREEGIDLHLQTSLHSVRREGSRRYATLKSGQEKIEIACDRILLAVGRLPNTEGLGLEAAGVEYDSKRIVVNDFLQTTAPHIYACGDLTGQHQFSHMAEYEAKRVVQTIVFPGKVRADFRLDPWATFTDPELVHLGLTEDQAKAQGLAYDVYRQPFAQNDRALTDNEAKGLVKVLTTGLAGRIIGVHILGPRAGELSHEWILAMEKGHTIRDIADLVHIYPTLSLACQHAAQRWYARKAEEPFVRSALAAYVKGIRPRQKALALGALGLALAGAAHLAYHANKNDR